MPEPSATSHAWVAGFLLLATVIQMVLSALLERSGPIRLRSFAEEAGGRLRELFDAPARLEAFRSVMSSIAKALPVALGATLTLLLAALGAELPTAALSSVVVVALVVLVVELVNRMLVRRDAATALAALTWLYRIASVLLLPLIVALAAVLPGITAPKDDEPEEEEEASEEEIDAFIDVGTREGILEPEQGDMVRGVVDFGDREVKSVMTPRIDIIAAPVATSLAELVPVFLDSKCSRLPLFKDSIDHVVGILHIRDLLRGLYADPAPSAAELAKPAYVVPPNKPLDELLREMQSRFQQMAIVVDEYGGTSGLVTVEDIIEPIVGDLGDEHEELEPQPQPVGDGSWRLEGRTHLPELEDLFGVELEEGPYETVGGLILAELGEVPSEGAVVEVAGLRLTVEQVSERRVERVRVEKVTHESEGEHV